MNFIKYPTFQTQTLEQIREYTQYNDILELNRHEYMDHVNELYMAMKDQLENDTFTFLSPIIFASDKSTGQVWILDGQHRIKAYERLIEERLFPENIDIPVSIINVINRDEAILLFARINKVQPYFELPEHANTIKQLMKMIQHTFPDAVKVNQKHCKSPRIMSTKLERDLIYFIELYSDFSIEQLFNKFILINTQLEKEFSQFDNIRETANRINNFYIGCHKDWYKNVDLGCQRKKMTNEDRKKVWGRVYSGCEGLCKGCQEKIDIFSFVIAHIIPISKKGTNDPMNLFPLCKDCNASMGNKTFIQYFGVEKAKNILNE